MERFFFTKPMMTLSSFAVNMVWVNERGEKLSIAGDNSHVAEQTVRHSYATFTGTGQTLKEDAMVFSTEWLLRVIAEHMGYTLSKK
jgi:hypothetical protein